MDLAKLCFEYMMNYIVYWVFYGLKWLVYVWKWFICIRRCLVLNLAITMALSWQRQSCCHDNDGSTSFLLVATRAFLWQSFSCSRNKDLKCKFYSWISSSLVTTRLHVVTKRTLNDPLLVLLTCYLSFSYYLHSFWSLITIKS